MLFAFDALGGGRLYLVSRDIPIAPDATLDKIADSHPDDVDVSNLDRTLTSARLRELLRVVFNAVLYATTAEVRIETRCTSQAKGTGKKSAKPPPARWSSEGVFFLPDHIDIVTVRRVQQIERAPGGRELMHRFMVRGYWRGANPWEDQRAVDRAVLEGPEMAAIERTIGSSRAK